MKLTDLNGYAQLMVAALVDGEDETAQAAAESLTMIRALAKNIVAAGFDMGGTHTLTLTGNQLTALGLLAGIGFETLATIKDDARREKM